MTKHLRIIYYILATLVLTGCQDKPLKSKGIQAEADISIPPKDHCQYYSITDELSVEEKNYLATFKKENQNILYFDKVTRFYSTKDSIVIFNKLEISKNTLVNEGYEYYEFYYTNELSDINISYRYSRGRADVVYGSVSGSGKQDYVHTYVGYGTTAKVVNVYSNGVELFSKTIDLTQ